MDDKKVRWWIIGQQKECDEKRCHSRACDDNDVDCSFVMRWQQYMYMYQLQDHRLNDTRHFIPIHISLLSPRERFMINLYHIVTCKMPIDHKALLLAYLFVSLSNLAAMPSSNFLWTFQWNDLIELGCRWNVLICSTVDIDYRSFRHSCALLVARYHESWTTDRRIRQTSHQRFSAQRLSVKLTKKVWFKCVEYQCFSCSLRRCNHPQCQHWLIISLTWHVPTKLTINQ